MSKHWKPDDEIAQALERRERASWPAGATAGLLLVAAACIGVTWALYHVAGPRDVFESGSE